MNWLTVSYGETAKQYRIQRRITQEEVAQGINTLLRRDVGQESGIVQATVSAWERGRQLPATEEVVEAHASVIDWDTGAAKEAWLSEKPISGYAGLGIQPKTYFQQATEYLNHINYKANLWFIGPDHLPALAAQSGAFIRDNWIANMTKGVNYRALWILDYVQKNTLQRVGRTFTLVQKHFDDYGSKPPGEFTNYGVREFGDISSGSVENAVGVFNRLEKESNELKNFHFKYCDEQIPEHCLGLLRRYAQAFGTILVYLPRSIVDPPAASICLQNVRSSIGGGENQAFHWFGEHDTEALAELAGTLQESYTNENGSNAQTK